MKNSSIEYSNILCYLRQVASIFTGIIVLCLIWKFHPFSCKKCIHNEFNRKVIDVWIFLNFVFSLLHAYCHYYIPVKNICFFYIFNWILSTHYCNFLFLWYSYEIYLIWLWWPSNRAIQSALCITIRLTRRTLCLF